MDETSEAIAEELDAEVVAVGGRTFIVLGTAHVSQESVAAVRRAVRRARPDSVAVEIDRERYASIVQHDRWSQLDIFRVIRNKQTFLLIANLVLAGFQKRIGGATGVSPGAEMVAAVRSAEEAGVPIVLADRPIQLTLRRAWASTNWWGRNKLLASLIAGAFSNEQLSEEDLRTMRGRGELESMMTELAEFLPEVKRVLIDERDVYLAEKSLAAPGDTVLMVVGAGHVQGIVAHLRASTAAEPRSTDELEVIPPPSIVRKALPFVVPALVIGLIARGFVRGGFQAGVENIVQWVLVNGILTSVGTVIALGHPLTILVSFLAAPLTSLNPTIGVGFVTGLLEAVLRRPRTLDFQRLRDDIGTLRGVYRNRLTRILLVFLCSTVGSLAATLIALPLLLR